MKFGLWSTTAGSNSAAPPDGWPEGQLPSTVNDCAREMMASIRTGLNDLQFIDLGVTPTQTGNTTFTLAGNQMQWYPYGNRVKANVGGTPVYGTVTSSTFTTNTGVTLRLDSGLLTASLSAVSTGFPSSANGAVPESVYRRKNVFINSCMDLWNRGNGPFALGGTLGNLYTADRWVITGSLTSTASVNVRRYERSANTAFVPTIAQAGLLITSSLGMSVSAAQSVVNAGMALLVGQKIEGYTFRQLAGKPMALSCWVNSRQTGTYCMKVGNAGSDQSYVTEFQISGVATWEKKTFSIPKSPLTGTWDYSSGIGLVCYIVLAAGSSFQGGAGNWTATSILATSNQTNFMASAGNVFMMTGFQLEEGAVSTPLEPIDIGLEAFKASRYFQNIAGNNDLQFIGNTVTNAIADFPIMLSPPLRGTASASFANYSGSTWTVANSGGSNFSTSSGSARANGPVNQIMRLNMQGTPLTAGQPCYLTIATGSSFNFDCEL